MCTILQAIHLRRVKGEEKIMIESIVEKTHPNKEIEVIRTYEYFGWVLNSSQEIETENSHYTNLMFQRDTSIPNYKQLTELEEKYWSIISIEPHIEKYGARWAVLTVLGIYCYVLPGLVIIACRMRKIKKSKKLHAEWAEKYNKEILEIHNMCLQLLDILED